MNTLTMTKISSNRAVVFGGRIGNETTSDIYISTITGTIVVRKVKAKLFHHT